MGRSDHGHAFCVHCSFGRVTTHPPPPPLHPSCDPPCSPLESGRPPHAPGFVRGMKGCSPRSHNRDGMGGSVGQCSFRRMRGRWSFRAWRDTCWPLSGIVRVLQSPFPLRLPVSLPLLQGTGHYLSFCLQGLDSAEQGIVVGIWVCVDHCDRN